MRWIDFHTHFLPAENVTALVSSVTPVAGCEYWSCQSLAGENPIELSQAKQAVAIGEIGLDRLKDIPLNQQLKELETSLKLAEELGLPVVLHSVRCYPEINGALKGFHGKVLHHRFQGSQQELQNQLQLGRYISLSPKEVKRGYLSNFSNLGLLALESDGQAVDWADFYGEVAKELQMEITELQSLMYQNFRKFLGL